MSIDLHTAVGEFASLLSDFATGIDGVRDAVAVSGDGLLVARSADLDRAGADHLAAIVSGLASLGRSTALRYDFDGLQMIMVEMRRGFLLVSAFSGGGCIGVLAEADGDLALIGYQVTVLVDRVGRLLGPALIDDTPCLVASGAE